MAAYCPASLSTSCRSRRSGTSTASVRRSTDVVWFDRVTRRVSSAFEVEHSTSIYRGSSGCSIWRSGLGIAEGSSLFLVAPDDRQYEVAQQLRRPAFSRVSQLGIRFLPYSQLNEHGPSIRRFGAGIKPLMEISQVL